MITTLPAGTYIRFRYQGSWDYGRVSPGQTSFQLMSASQIPPDVKVHQCVWKVNDVLESRKILPPGFRFNDDR